MVFALTPRVGTPTVLARVLRDGSVFAILACALMPGLAYGDPQPARANADAATAERELCISIGDNFPVRLRAPQREYVIEHPAILRVLVDPSGVLINLQGYRVGVTRLTITHSDGSRAEHSVRVLRLPVSTMEAQLTALLRTERRVSVRREGCLVVVEGRVSDDALRLRLRNMAMNPEFENALQLRISGDRPTVGRNLLRSK